MLALEVLLKMGLGGLVGWERELHGRPAGMRTHMLMILGVVLFSEASKAFGGGTPDRIAAQVVTGVGFLGAGTIMRMGLEIKGLTTAASLWAVAALGMAISAGGPFILIALAGALITLFTLDVVDNFERRIKQARRTHMLRMHLSNQMALLPALKALEQADVQLESFKVLETETGLQVTLEVHGAPEKIMQAVANIPGVSSARWSE